MISSFKLGHLVSFSLAFGLLLSLVGDRRELAVLAAMCLRRKSKVQSIAHDNEERISLLDLPELAIETVLLKLPPQSLCKAASVCKELYKKCSSDHLWLPHVQSKWGRVVGPLAFKEWQTHMYVHVNPCKSDDITMALCKPLTGWPICCLWSSWAKLPIYASHKLEDTHNSYMQWYTTLETGAFWFPAQVYNRENGHVGFLLSCYDAELSYNRQTDTFTARYPPHGSCSPLQEEGVSWQRLRAPPIPITAHELYISSSLKDLRPGDHAEVQWRRTKRFPYGWWYGVVGHVETCDKDSQHCRCHLDDMIWLEFNQYAPGSRWRRTGINRQLHTEKGDEAEGFYAGIRQLCSKEEVSAWMQLWPKETLE